MRIAIIGLVLFVPAAMLAQEKWRDVDEPLGAITIGEQSYQDARITKVGLTQAIVKVDSGLRRVDLQNLPEPARSKYYDPAKVAAAQKANQEAQKAQALADQRMYQARLKQWREANFRIVNGKEEDTRGWTAIRGQVAQVLHDGLLIQTVKKRRVLDRPILTPRQRAGAYVSGPHYITFDVPDRIVFVKNFPNFERFADGDNMNFTAMPTGIYRYTERGGGTASVDMYDFGLPLSSKE